MKLNLSNNENKVILLAVICYILIYLMFFPSMYVSIDEHEYAKNAVLFSEGKLGVQEPEYACRSDLLNSNGYVSKYFPGKSFFLIPFTFFGINAIMLSGLLVHLANFLLLILILKKLKVNKIFSLLYLFLPVMLWSSRTLYPELLVLTGFLAGTLFFIESKKRDWLISGFFFSLAVLVRYDAIFGLLAFLIPCLLKKNWSKAIYFALGAVPVGIVILIFNTFAYSGAFNTGTYSGLGLVASLLFSERGLIEGFFSRYFADLIIYSLILLAMYPLMLISPFISKKFSLKQEFALIIIAYLILNARFTEFFAFAFSIESTFVARLRYLIPLIGLLIIPYSVLLDNFIKENKIVIPKIILAIGFIALILGTGFMSMKHSELVNTRANVLTAIQEGIPEDSLVIGSSDDCIYFQKEIFENKKYLNIDFEQGLAGNPENLEIEQFISNDTYVMELYYGNRVNRDSIRQGTVNAERQKIVDFINENESNLELIHEDLEGNTLRIYRWIQ